MSFPLQVGTIKALGPLSGFIIGGKRLFIVQIFWKNPPKKSFFRRIHLYFIFQQWRKRFILKNGIFCDWLKWLKKRTSTAVFSVYFVDFVETCQKAFLGLATFFEKPSLFRLILKSNRFYHLFQSIQIRRNLIFFVFFLRFPALLTVVILSLPLSDTQKLL